MKRLLSFIVILGVLMWMSGCSMSDKTVSEVKDYYLDEYRTQLYESVTDIKGPEASPISYAFIINKEGIMIDHPRFGNSGKSIFEIGLEEVKNNKDNILNLKLNEELEIEYKRNDSKKVRLCFIRVDDENILGISMPSNKF